MGWKTRIATYVTLATIAFKLGGCASDIADCKYKEPENCPASAIYALNGELLEDYHGSLYCVDQTGLQEIEENGLESMLR